jgi:hypothetical protein
MRCIDSLYRWLALLALLLVASAASLSVIPLPDGADCPSGVDPLFLFDVIVGGAAYVDCLERRAAPSSYALS